MSDPNLKDAMEPRGEGAESVDDELDIVEGSDEVDEFEAAEAEAGEPAEEEALHVEDDSDDADADEEEADERCAGDAADDVWDGYRHDHHMAML